VYLARVIGRVVATLQYEGLTGVPLQWIQPLDENGADMGDALVACAVVSTGPGDLVHFVDGREGALACPVPFVPVDAAIIGYVEAAVSMGRYIGRDDDRASTTRSSPDAESPRSDNPSRRSDEQSLRSENQSLRSGDQSLRSGNQSLRSGNQSLRSGNQSLRSCTEVR
jgi:microcompartment protein CcmK/EutM